VESRFMNATPDQVDGFFHIFDFESLILDLDSTMDMPVLLDLLFNSHPNLGYIRIELNRFQFDWQSLVNTFESLSNFVFLKTVVFGLEWPVLGNNVSIPVSLMNNLGILLQDRIPTMEDVYRYLLIWFQERCERKGHDIPKVLSYCDSDVGNAYLSLYSDNISVIRFG
jgi:hypothetical protein